MRDHTAERCDAGVILGQGTNLQSVQNEPEKLLTEGSGRLPGSAQTRSVVEYFSQQPQIANNLAFFEGSFMRGLFTEVPQANSFPFPESYQIAC